MVSRYTKLRVRRQLRRQQQTIERAGSEANRQFEYNVVRRWRNLREVRRFVAGWLFLVALLVVGVYVQSRSLSAFYEADKPISGGVYREGVKGKFTNINPIFASTNADLSASKLMFNSLLRYDPTGNIIGDIATDWEVSERGSIYTVSLREDVYWHDGRQLTAEDVVFTYEAIQHPDSRSVLSSSWQNIKVQMVDTFTVSFTLPNPFTPFPNSLTQGGILPKHVLGGVLPSQLRGHPFNTSEPIGTGPFSFKELSNIKDDQQLTLSRNDQYYRGRPNISQFVLRTYADNESLAKAFSNGELAGAANLPFDTMPAEDGVTESVFHNIPLTNAIYIFIKTSEDVLKNPDIRQAFTNATNQESILELSDNRPIAVDSPLLKGQLGYNKEITQAGYDLEKATTKLDEINWKLGDDGVRVNGKKRLSFELVTQNSDNYPQIAEELKRQWAEAGIELNIVLVEEDQIRQANIVPHNYQLLLFGITIGHDPDVFAYWHSSQTGPGGFNFSEYESDAADIALEAGRTRDDDTLRSLKYEPLLRQWKKDAPAIGLLQPSFIYAHQDRVVGFETVIITSAEERFNNVHKWFINTRTSEKPY